MRSTPFDLVFRPFSQEVFPGVRRALKEGGHDPRDRDRFLMLREVVTLLRELRPEQGLGEGIDQLAALLHHAYLYWDAGEPTFEIPLHLVAARDARVEEQSVDSSLAYYAVAPEHRIWAEVVPGQPSEPLDGCFVHYAPGAALRVLGVFGMHRDRAGFSVVEAAGSRPVALTRADGSHLFEPTLPGGKAAGLFSI
ncbi:MAG TPA: hypothetical protein VFH26_04920, partial [Gemmatimonadales bacterium]|nr:hypothetical protein [Gemmatimonadales bacterium]